MQYSSSRTVDGAPGPRSKPHCGPSLVADFRCGSSKSMSCRGPRSRGILYPRRSQLGQGPSGPKMADAGIKHTPGAGFPSRIPLFDPYNRRFQDWVRSSLGRCATGWLLVSRDCQASHQPAGALDVSSCLSLPLYEGQGSGGHYPMQQSDSGVIH